MRSGPLAPTKVTVVQASQSRLTPALFGIGTVEARRSYLIGPTVAARVRAVAVDVGDSVKAGQLLAEMDPVDLDERTAAHRRLDRPRRQRHGRSGSTAARRAAPSVNWRRSTHVAMSNWEHRTSSAPAPSRPDCRNRPRPKPGSRCAGQPRRGAAGPAAAECRTGRAAPAARQRAPAGAQRRRRREPRCRTRLHRRGRAGRGAGDRARVAVGQGCASTRGVRRDWPSGCRAQIVLRSNPGSGRSGKVARVEAVSDSVTEERVAQVSFDQLPASLSIGELAEVTLSLPPRPAPCCCPTPHQAPQGQTGVWRDRRTALPPSRRCAWGQASLDGQVQVLEGLKAGSRRRLQREGTRPGSRIKVVDALARRRP
jgi:HlyD family secretion protein